MWKKAPRYLWSFLPQSSFVSVDNNTYMHSLESGNTQIIPKSLGVAIFVGWHRIPNDILQNVSTKFLFPVLNFEKRIG